MDFTPRPKVDPLLRIRRSDTAENLRQKGEALHTYHGDEDALADYNEAADRVEHGGFANYGEWERSVLSMVGTTREAQVADMKAVFGEEWDDPYIEWEDGEE